MRRNEVIIESGKASCFETLRACLGVAMYFLIVILFSLLGLMTIGWNLALPSILGVGVGAAAGIIIMFYCEDEF